MFDPIDLMPRRNKRTTMVQAVNTTPLLLYNGNSRSKNGPKPYSFNKTPYFDETKRFVKGICKKIKTDRVIKFRVQEV
jgi:hypothetical protein